MIRGAVTSDLEAVIRLAVRGPRGRKLQVEAVLDTGFNGFLTLPPRVMSRLGLLYVGPASATLGEGTIAELSVFEGTVVWDGRARDVGVLQADGEPLVGMLLLYGFDLRVRVVEGGAVSIARSR